MLINQDIASGILKKYGMDMPKTYIISKASDLDKIKEFSFPAVLKVDSPEVIHKSDMGLVFTKIDSFQALKEKLSEGEKILANYKIKKYRFILQEMVTGAEFLIGMKRDHTFGPVIMFGMGGIFVEVFRDVSMRIAPLTRKDCLEMITEVKCAKLLDGYRNMPKIDKESLINLLLKVSKLSIKERHLSELDFNPVMAKEDRVIVVDARLISDQNA